MAFQPAACHGSGSAETDLDWEDWDPKEGSFVHHMIAGSFAGVAEHALMFPVDTIKTFIQCERCVTPCVKQQVVPPSHPSTLSAVTKLVQQEGFLRLWRGVSTMFIACIPAHAAYFSVLETCKAKFGVNDPEHNVLGAAATGGIATVFHDAIMTPLDVIKQRLQLGYYKGIVDCASTVARTEGMRAFYLSLPVTLFMNIPYGCVMVASNESFKRMISPSGDYSTLTYLAAGSGAGAIAAAATTPLDLIKTRLQTQVVIEAMDGVGSQVPAPPTAGGGEGGRGGTSSGGATAGGGSGGSGGAGRGGGVRSVGLPVLQHSHQVEVQRAYMTAAARGRVGGQPPVRGHVTVTGSGCMRAEHTKIRYHGIVDAVKQIYAAEGVAGFFRGVGPRLMVHTPSVAISWTTYETVKGLLKEHWGGSGGDGGSNVQ